MAERILDGTQKESEPFTMSLPFWVKISGDMSENRCQLQSRFIDDDEWGLEKEFNEYDKSCVVPGIREREIEFRVVCENPGIKASWGRANVSFNAR